MGKKKRHGRDRKDLKDERPRGPGGVQKDSNVRKSEQPEANVKPEQFPDADCEFPPLTGTNRCKDPIRPQVIPDECSAVAKHYNITNAETKHNERKVADVPSKNTKGDYDAYSRSSQQTFLNTPDANAQCHSSASTARVESSRKTNIVKRPNFGTDGRLIPVVSNYFLLKGSGNDVYHYDVEITDKSQAKKKTMTIKEEKENGATVLEIQQKRNIGKQKCRDVILRLIKDKSLAKYQPFFDGYKNLYSFQPLPIGEGKSAEVCLSDGSRTKTFLVTVKPVKRNGGGNVISLELLNKVCSGRSSEVPLEAVTAFDMILCHRNPPFHQIGIGKSFFSVSEMKTPKDCHIEICKGYNSSLQLTQKGPAILINVANKAFYSGGFIIEHACYVLGFDITERNLSTEDIGILTESLRGVKIEVTHLPYPRKYTVESVTKKNASDLQVEIGARNISVSQFFAQKYKRLKFPYLPCLSMKTTGNRTYTPMEVCVILPKQPKLGKLTPQETAAMITETAIQPKDRFDKIRDLAKTISQISGTCMKQAGYDMELTPQNLTARVLTAPALAYSNEQLVQPDLRGVWRIDGKSFSEPSSNARWILISFADPKTCTQAMLEQLSSALVRASRNVGLNLSNPVAVKSFDRNTSTSNALDYAKSCGIQFAFVILSRRDKYHSYEELKFVADVKLGLITQCMEDVVVSRCCRGPGGGQILNNLLSKLNTKLGGINHTFFNQPAVTMKKTIVMGADAAHSPRGSKCPSIAAVVGSIDEVPFQYAVSCKVQMNPDESKLSQEIILDMKEMTKHVLNSYRKKNGYFPERIIFFRDGVSQGQFETVLQEELTLIQKACYELCKKKLPVAFIVIQKRHQTRFVPRNSKDGVGKGGNVPPGTTVDTDVTHPVYFDYFQCSHEGIKGTSKPAHYVVLHDDNKFKADELQKFSHELCHVYGRCNRSISIPAPAMNAHLAAARAKKYVDFYLSGKQSKDGPSSLQDAIDHVNNTSEISAPMFFV